MSAANATEDRLLGRPSRGRDQGLLQAAVRITTVLGSMLWDGSTVVADDTSVWAGDPTPAKLLKADLFTPAS